MGRKQYIRPTVVLSHGGLGLIPAVVAAAATGLASVASTAASVASVGAALAGGYMVGRVVKSMEIRPEETQLRALRKVHC